MVRAREPAHGEGIEERGIEACWGVGHFFH
jgi:hypothetical protein